MFDVCWRRRNGKKVESMKLMIKTKQDEKTKSTSLTTRGDGKNTQKNDVWL